MPVASPSRVAAAYAVLSSYDWTRVAGTDFIDVDKLGRGKGSPKGVLRDLGFYIAKLLNSQGKVFLKDNHDLIGPALTPKAVQDQLWAYVHEEAGYLAESERYGLSEAWLRRSEEAEKARIKVEPVTSPRTGQQGYRLTWSGWRAGPKGFRS